MHQIPDASSVQIPGTHFAHPRLPTRAITASVVNKISAVGVRANELLVATTAGVIERIPWDKTYLDVSSCIVLTRLEV
jgi:hypothetical protein